MITSMLCISSKCFFVVVMRLPKVTDLNMDQLKWSGTDKIANIGLELLILNSMLDRAF